MNEVPEAVRERYARSGIMERVAVFLRERGVDPEHPGYEDFFPSTSSTAVE